jgi:hypothetical protein
MACGATNEDMNGNATALDNPTFLIASLLDSALKLVFNGAPSSKFSLASCSSAK